MLIYINTGQPSQNHLADFFYQHDQVRDDATQMDFFVWPIKR